MSGNLVLALYLSLGRAGATVEFADRQGWRLPSKKGPELPRRRYCTADVYALVKGKPCAIPSPSSPALARMALAQLARGQGR